MATEVICLFVVCRRSVVVVVRRPAHRPNDILGGAYATRGLAPPREAAPPRGLRLHILNMNTKVGARRGRRLEPSGHDEGRRLVSPHSQGQCIQQCPALGVYASNPPCSLVHEMGTTPPNFHSSRAFARIWGLRHQAPSRPLTNLDRPINHM